MDTLDLENKIELIDKEIFEIFKIVTNEKDISMYKSGLLNAKLQILEDYLGFLFKDIFKIETKRLNRLKITSYIIKLSLFLSVICIFFTPIFGIILTIINYLSLRKFYVDSAEIIEMCAKKIENYGIKLMKMNIELDNCHRFLNARTNECSKIKEEEINNEDLKVIDLDDEKINIDVIDASDSETFQKVLKETLQKELQTDEEDLEKLLDLANINNENPEEMRLIRTKKDKK